MKISEIKELSSKDLVERIDAERVVYLQGKVNHAITPAEDTSKLRQARRDIARMKTVLRQREINEKK